MKLNKKIGVILLITCMMLATLTSTTATDWPMFQDNPRHTGYISQDTSYSTQEWTTKLDGSIIAPPALSGNILYVGSDSGKLYALDAQDGNETWTYDMDGAIKSTPSISGNTVFTGCDDGYLYSNNAETGTLNWKFKSDDSIQTTPAVADGKIFFGSDDHHLP